MANADVIAKGLIELEEVAEELGALMDVLLEVGGDHCPTWVGLVYSHVHRLDKAMEAHGNEVRQRALPLLKDFEQAKGGMGAVAPMETSGGVPARSRVPVNGNGLGKPTVQARPDSSTRK